MKKIIILGGTSMARNFLEKIVAHPADVFCFYSLKNISGNNFLPAIGAAARAKVIAGGFSQYDDSNEKNKNPAQGFATFCKQEKIDAVVVAVSPFATVMITTAVAVAKKLSLPLFYLQPTPWGMDDDIKNKKITLAQDIAGLTKLFLHHWRNMRGDKNIFLALGAKDGGAFLSFLKQPMAEHLEKNKNRPIIFWRAIYQPSYVPDNHTIKNFVVKILLMPPQDEAQEKKFLQEKNIGLLIGKNSGGDHNNNRNKILAAMACNVPTLLLSPPMVPAMANDMVADKNHFTSGDDLLPALLARLGLG